MGIDICLLARKIFDGIVELNSVNIVHYAFFIWFKSSAKQKAHLTESNVQTRFRKSNIADKRIYKMNIEESLPKDDADSILREKRKAVKLIKSSEA